MSSPLGASKLLVILIRDQGIPLSRIQEVVKLLQHFLPETQSIQYFQLSFDDT